MSAFRLGVLPRYKANKLYYDFGDLRSLTDLLLHINPDI